mgnify:CR=1 FL=1
MDPVLVTFDFGGNLDEEVKKVTLSIKGMRDESASTYKRLLADSNAAYNSLSKDNKILAVAIQDSIVALRRLADAKEALNEKFKQGEISTNDYAEAAARLAVQEAELKSSISGMTKELERSMQSDRLVIGSIVQKQDALSILKNEYNNLTEEERDNVSIGGALLAKIKAQKDELDGLSESTKNSKGSTVSLIDAVDDLPGPLGRTASGVKSVSKAMVALMANPVVLFLAAIAAGLAALFSWFKRTEEGENALAVATSVFTGVLNTLLDVVDDVGEWLFKAFTKPKEALKDVTEFIKGQFTNRLDALAKMGKAIVKIFSEDWKQGFADYAGAVSQFTTGIVDAGGKMQAFYNDIKANAKASYDLGLREVELEKKKRAWLVDRAKLEAQIQDLRLKGDQKDMYSAAKRLEFQNKASSLIEKMTANDKAIAAEELDIMKERNSLSHKNKAALDAEAEATKKLFDVEQEGARARREMQEKRNSTRNEISADARKAAEKEKKYLEEYKKELEAKKEAYERYFAYVETIGEESANKQFATLIQSGKTYYDYIQSKIAELSGKENLSDKDVNRLAFLYEEANKVSGKKTAVDVLKSQIEQLKILYGDDLGKLKDELIKLQSGNAGNNTTQGFQMQQAIEDALTETDKAAAQKFKDLLDTYQTGFQRLASLEKSYNDDVAFLRAQITDKSTEEEKKRIEDTITARSKAYGQAVLQEGDLFKKLFGDLERESTSSLEDMFSKLKTVDTSKVFSNPQDIKTFQDAVKKLESELRTRNPFKQLNKDFSRLLKDIKSGKDTKDALSGLTESFAGAKQYVGELGDSLGQVFGEETSYAIDQALQLGQAVFDVGSGAAKLANGDIIGGVKDIIKGIGSVFSMANKVKEMNRLAREDNQKFYDAALKGEREHQMLIRERLRTEQQIGETSLAYNKRITEELAKQSAASSSEYNRLLREIQGEQYISGKGYKHGTLFRKAKTWNEYASLSGKTYEDIEKLYDKGQLDEKVASLFEQMKALKEEGADINQMIVDQAESIRELYTGTTSEAIADSILSGFAEGKRSAADFADSFQEMLNSAVLNGVKMRALEEPLRQWYEQFAEASGSGLTSDKIAELKAAYDKIINDAAKQLSDAEKITGIGLIGGDVSRSATAKGVASMNQDSADELNGNFNALLIYADKASNGISNIQSLMITGLSVLNRIEENTRFCRRLEGIESDMGRMRADIESIVLKGIYIKTK